MEPKTVTLCFHYTTNCNGKQMQHTSTADTFDIDSTADELKSAITDTLGIKSFYFEYNDPSVGIVSFEHGCLRNILPKHINDSGVQPTNSQQFVIDLYIRRISQSQQDHSEVRQQTTTNHFQLCPTPNHSVEQPIDERRESSSLILLTKDCDTKFTENVNPIIRDEYSSNTKSTRTRKKKGSPVSIQGYKMGVPSNKKRTSVLPSIRICKRIFPCISKVVLTAFILREICKDGRRILYHHPIYEFFTGDKKKKKKKKRNDTTEVVGDTNKISTTSKHVVLPWDKRFLEEQGHKIKLKLQAKVGAKTHSNESEEVFYEPEALYDKDTSYETNRLGIVIQYNDGQSRDELLLSDGFEFRHSREGIDWFYQEFFDRNGKLVDQIARIRTNATSSTAQTEIDRSPPRKKCKTSNKRNMDSDNVFLNSNQPSTSTITTNKVTQVNAQGYSICTSMTDTFNILSSSSPPNVQDHSMQSVCLSNSANITLNQQYNGDQSMEGFSPLLLDLPSNSNERSDRNKIKSIKAWLLNDL